jgi:hypothetical protein
MSPRPMLNFFKVAQTAVRMKERNFPAAEFFGDGPVYTPQFQSVRERTNARTAARTPPTRKKGACTVNRCMRLLEPITSI